jgi:hypothetical protein
MVLFFMIGWMWWLEFYGKAGELFASS